MTDRIGLRDVKWTIWIPLCLEWLNILILITLLTLGIYLWTTGGL